MSDLPQQLDQAQYLYENNQLDPAELLYQAILLEYPHQLQASMGLGYIYRLRGQPNQALAQFRLVEQYYPEVLWTQLAIVEQLRDAQEFETALQLLTLLEKQQPDQFDIIFHKAYVYRRANQAQSALVCFQKAVALNPSFLPAKLALIEQYRDMGLFNEALTYLDTVEQAYCQDISVIIHKAYIYRHQNKHELALACFQQALLLQADHFQVQLEIAIEYRDLNRLTESAELFVLLENNCPNNFQVSLQKAYLYRAYDRTQALAFFQQAVSLDESNLQAKLAVVEEYRDNGLFRQALEYLESFEQNYCPNIYILLAKAYIYRHQGRRELALSVFQEALLLQADHFQVQLEIANEYRDTGDLIQALALFSSLEINYPDNFYVILQKAYLYRYSDRTQALCYFQKAAVLNNTNLQVKLAIIEEYRDAGLFDNALSYLETFAQNYCHNIYIPLAKAYIYRNQGKHQLALNCFQDVIALDNTQLDYLLALAIEQFSLGQINNAINSVTQLLKQQPEHLAALIQLGQWLNSANCKAQALSFFQKALLLHPYQVQAYLTTAQSLFDLGKTQESFLLLTKATENCGEKFEIYALKANLLWLAKEITAAITTLECALQLFADNYYLKLQLIQYLVELGFFNKAILLMNQLPLDSLDKRLQVKLLHAKIAEKQWLIPKAMALYEQLLIESPHYLEAHHALRRLALLTLNVAKAKNHALIITEQSLGVQKINGQQGRAHFHDHLAQLTDEYVLNQDTLNQLETALTLLPQPRLQQLAAIVTNEQHATSAAVTFLSQLRQQYYFNCGIPKRIFQYWDKLKPPAEVLTFTQSWLQHNPDYEYQLFNEQTAREFLRSHYSSQVFTAYCLASHAAQKADLLRLALLVEYGGIYADADDICLKPLSLLITKQTELLLYQEEYGTVGNNFIAVCAKHPVLKIALDYAIEALLKGDKDSIWLSTGPAMLSRALALYLAEQWAVKTPNELNIVIITREQLMAVVGIHAQLPYKATDDSWLIKEFNSGQRFDLMSLLGDTG